MEGKNGSDNAIGNLNDTPVWFRVALAVAMLGGAGSGYNVLTSDTSDRYYASQAASDLQIRDERMARLQTDIDRLADRVKGYPHRDPGPATATSLREINARLRKLEDDNLRDAAH